MSISGAHCTKASSHAAQCLSVIAPYAGLEVFDIARPEPAQRMRIIQNEAAMLRRKTGLNIRSDKVGCDALADRQDIDLRKTTRLVTEAFARALQAGELVAKLLLPKIVGQFQIGFRS